MSKAKNLDLLRKTFFKSKIVIPKYFYFSKGNYLKSKNNYIKKIFILCKKNTLIIRSSSVNEDQTSFTNAGKFMSKIIKKNSDISYISFSLKNFIKQFSKSNDTIIVQHFIEGVNFSGVIFTKDINLNTPYYQINYDNSGKTNLITSGAKNEKKKQVIIYKHEKNFSKFQSLINACEILEKKLNNDRLDIEFCVKNKKLHLLQVRSLPEEKSKEINKKIYNKKIFDNFLVNIKKKLIKLKTENPSLSGKTTYFSNMSDWNPAEMIGEKPKPLAISLYRELITDHVWSEQRKQYGYKDVFPNVLLFSFGGSPYIDLRTDFTSFLPNTLSEENSSSIVSNYLKEFNKNSIIHDKIEFNLIETCYSFNSHKRLKKIFPKKLSKIYLKELKLLTRNIFNSRILETEKNKIIYLKKNLINFSKTKNHIQNIHQTIKITKDYGTLPFSGFARCAFISQRILIDLKELNLISHQEFNNFFNSLDTITSIFNKNYIELSKKKITKNSFLNKYGHLRPSTYDINSPNYRDGFNQYFTKNYKYFNKKNKNTILFKKYNEINKMMKQHFNINFKTFLNFAKESISFREEGKFVFTKGINIIFDNLQSLGKKIGVKQSDLAYIDIKTIINYHSKLENKKLATSVKEQIVENKKEYEISKLIKLPDVIKNSNDIYTFYESFNKINFITNLSLASEIIEVKKNNLSKLENKIVLIKNADPGYDYIFNFKIKGLITQYGGSNSHMAIRCLELNIPAAIGLGKLHYEKIVKVKKVLLDCKNKMLIPLK
jgi:phosphohistidine swiveling domain-containing protein